MHNATSPTCPTWCVLGDHMPDDVDESGAAWTSHFGEDIAAAPCFRVAPVLSVTTGHAEADVLLDTPGSGDPSVLSPAQARHLAAALTEAADRAEGHR